MVRQPQNLAEAKQIFREEKRKVTSSLAAIAGSRWLTAILAALVLVFGTHSLYAPTRLPTVSGLSLAQLGLPSGVDFGVAGEQAAQARDAAIREDVPGRIETLLTDNAELIPTLNMIGFALFLALLLGNLWIMTVRRPYSRG